MLPVVAQGSSSHLAGTLAQEVRLSATDLRFTLPAAGPDRAHDSNVVPPETGRLSTG
ncbi:MULTISPECIES: hypothetical protein [Actinomycetes]|uniref:hypothetical protein n=1 Tax=Actinomycetes TaxID=1760 RepID=UPI0001B57564|nr:hypothetical protein [Amycolatopsis sp. AA4]